MSEILQGGWIKYIELLQKLSTSASLDFAYQLHGTGGRWKDIAVEDIPRGELLAYTKALVDKYGEGASSLACEMYDLVSELAGVPNPPAEPADLPTVDDVAKTVYGAAKAGNRDIIANAVGRLVKQTGQDTILRNSIRDGAQVAWIPSGDTCVFCLTLASRGWQTATSKMLKNGHAEHIHSNCDCSYATNFNNKVNYAGYDPRKYEDMWYSAEGANSKEKLNALRRGYYQESKDRINAQKRAAYEKRKELNTDI